MRNFFCFLFIIFAIAIGSSLGKAHAGTLDVDMKKFVAALDVLGRNGCEIPDPNLVDTFVTINGYDGIEDFRAKHKRLYGQLDREFRRTSKRQIQIICEKIMAEWELAQ